MAFDPVAVRAQRETMLLRMLFRSTQAMNAEMSRRLAARGWTDFKGSYTGLLGHLDTEGTSISTLAEQTDTTRQAVSQLARSIEQAGFLERVPHQTDGRRVVARHTDRGRRVLLDALEVMTEIEHEYAQLIGPEGLAELKRLLTSLLAAIDPHGALRWEESDPPDG